MAVIHIISLDADIEREIKEKRYSEAQIIELNKKLQKDRNDRKKVFLIVMVLISVGILGYGTYVIGKTIGFPEAVPIILFFIIILPIIGAVIWYAVVGNMMRQWNSLVRQYYPNVYTKLKGENDGAITADEAENTEPVNLEKGNTDSGIAGKEKNPEFAALEKDIEQLNKINTKANYTARDRYISLYESIYERLLDMEKDGSIVLEPGKKGLGYLRELLQNDGPEFSYTIVFRYKENAARKYKIGVCIRGLPICKPYE